MMVFVELEKKNKNWEQQTTTGNQERLSKNMIA